MRMDMEEIVAGIVVALLFALLAAAVVGMMCLAADSFYERKAFDATAACESSRGVPKRKSLSTHVVCVPNPARRDTTAVEVIAK